MAAAMRKRCQEAGCCTACDLLGEGFSREEVTRLGPAAVAQAGCCYDGDIIVDLPDEAEAPGVPVDRRRRLELAADFLAIAFILGAGSYLAGLCSLIGG
ncbi:hypothetical protein [Chelatococcus asaccharovorans]|uniref:hypothetical protein n=1 Tax=Chelatococcus asaccharovorans TaxID=28210 RepID=UPI002264177A|nr:hypothetical protein [Chelatococcus asaccharovorans]